uniref:Uncharacterized protein n=1 Tax=Arion vulgaris TaxID=1028688 RepID=A0A0B6YT99_9EUPU
MIPTVNNVSIIVCVMKIMASYNNFSQNSVTFMVWDELKKCVDVCLGKEMRRTPLLPYFP